MQHKQLDNTNMTTLERISLTEAGYVEHYTNKWMTIHQNDELMKLNSDSAHSDDEDPFQLLDDDKSVAKEAATLYDIKIKEYAVTEDDVLKLIQNEDGEYELTLNQNMYGAKCKVLIKACSYVSQEAIENLEKHYSNYDIIDVGYQADNIGYRFQYAAFQKGIVLKIPTNA
jgi:hypothetical protein